MAILDTELTLGEIPEYPVEGGYIHLPDIYNDMEPLIVNHSGNDGGPFAIAAYAKKWFTQDEVIISRRRGSAGKNIMSNITFVLNIKFINGRMFEYPDITANSPEELQLELDKYQGESLSLAVQSKLPQFNPIFANYRPV